MDKLKLPDSDSYLYVFTEEEVKSIRHILDDKELLHEILEARRTWNAMGKLAGSIKTFIAWFLFMGAAYVTFKGGLLTWLKDELLK